MLIHNFVDLSIGQAPAYSLHIFLAAGIFGTQQAAMTDGIVSFISLGNNYLLRLS